MAMDGRAARERRTSLFDAKLGANLSEQVFQLAHFSFETRTLAFTAASSEMLRDGDSAAKPTAEDD